MTNYSKENIKKYALNYLNRYASSKKNLKNVLLRKIKKFNNNEKEIKIHIKNILDELQKENIINDEKFANSIAFNYAQTGKSKKFIKFKLLQKGINIDDINNALQNLEEENPDFEIQSAIHFARKKKLGKFGNSLNKKRIYQKWLELALLMIQSKKLFIKLNCIKIIIYNIQNI